MRFYQLAAIIASAALCTACCTDGKTVESLYEGLPFDMAVVQVPSIPSHSVSIADFGGVPDGKTLNTQAFAEAIAKLSELGGGRLEVPAGIWRTGPIGLQSHIELYVSKNAVIVFDPDQDLYPIFIPS